MSNRLLNVVYRIVRNYAWWVIIASVIVTISAIVFTFVISDLPMRSSFLNLLPQGDPILEEFEKREEIVKQVDSLFILLSINPSLAYDFSKSAPYHPSASSLALNISSISKISEEKIIKRLKEEAEKIKGTLLQEEEISSVSYSSDLTIPGSGLFISIEKLQDLGNYIDKVSQLLKTSSFKFEEGRKLAKIYEDINNKIEESLTLKDRNKAVDPEVISAQLERLEKLNTNLRTSLKTLPQKMGKARQEIDDLLKLMSNLQEKPTPDSEQDIYISKNKLSLLVSVKPRFSSQRGLEYNRKVTQIVKKKVNALSPSLRGIEVKFAGPYVAMTEVDQAVKNDMRNTTLISSLGIAVLFLLIFRTIYPLIVLIIPLFIGLILTLAWAKFSVGGLNLITSFLPALILGLGVDYGIHFLARYMEERRNGKHIEEALKKTILKKGSASLSAALTTSCVFLILSLARSRGLFEMGIVGGVGILLTFTSMLFVLPSLIIISHLVLKRKFKVPPPEEMIRLRSPIKWALRKRKEIVILILVTTFFTFFPAMDVEFQFASENLIPGNLASMKTAQKIEKDFDLQTETTEEAFIFFAKSKEDMKGIVESLKQNQMVDRVISIESLIPDHLAGEMKLLEELELEQAVESEMEVIEESLAEKGQITGQIGRLVENLSSLQILALFYGQEEVGKDLNSLIKQLTQLKASFQELNSSHLSQNLIDLRSRIGLLESRLRELTGSAPESRSVERLLEILPKTVRDKFLTPQEEFIIYAYPASGKLDRENYYHDFMKSLAEISDNFLGMSMIEDRLEIHMRRDFWITTIFAGIAILTLLWVRLRKSWFTLILALLPLVLGYIWMLGMMKLLGITFSFANIIISPLLIGIGVDNGIHLLHRFAEEGEILKATTLAGIAILATTLTTLLVFGSLIFAQTPGLNLLGKSALLGLGFTTLFSLLFLPTVLSLRED